jgi:pimeloyl-ACP methyl ester carboxylesterase
MRRVHWAVEHRLGRILTKRLLRTRISAGRWDPVPIPPANAATRISPTPLLIVHGDRDEYFPSDHAEQLFEAAGQPKELWIEKGFGHAESSISTNLIDRIAQWGVAAVTASKVPAVSAVADSSSATVA